MSSCPHCDTDFVGTDGPEGGLFDDAGELAAGRRPSSLLRRRAQGVW